MTDNNLICINDIIILAEKLYHCAIVPSYIVPSYHCTIVTYCAIVPLCHLIVPSRCTIVPFFCIMQSYHRSIPAEGSIILIQPKEPKTNWANYWPIWLGPKTKGHHWAASQTKDQPTVNRSTNQQSTDTKQQHNIEGPNSQQASHHQRPWYTNRPANQSTNRPTNWRLTYWRSTNWRSTNQQQTTNRLQQPKQIRKQIWRTGWPTT